MATATEQGGAELPSRDSAGYATLLAPFLAVPAIALLAQLIGHQRGLWIGDSNGLEARPFEMAGALGSLGLVALAAFRYRRARGELEELLRTALVIGAGFAALGYVVEHSARSWDYQCYEEAARRILSGLGPYHAGYLYPPFLAQLFAVATLALLRIGGPFADDPSRWELLFLGYQLAQVALVMACAELGRRLLEARRVATLQACVLVGLALAVDAPLLRTLRFNQVNLWVLACILVALLEHQRRPALAGGALALGASLKLYPLALLLPLGLQRDQAGRLRPRPRLLLWTFVGGAVSLAFQTEGFSNWAPLAEFAQRLAQFPGGDLLRDNSPAAILFRALLLVNPADRAQDAQLAMILHRVLAAGVGLWVIWRIVRRERQPGEDPDRALWSACDMILWMLVASPRVWEHHFVLLLPVFWLVASRARASRLRLALAFVLIFAIPTFDLFLLSDHRLAGLLLLWTLVPPQPEPATA